MMPTDPLSMERSASVRQRGSGIDIPLRVGEHVREAVAALVELGVGELLPPSKTKVGVVLPRGRRECIRVRWYPWVLDEFSVFA